MQENDFAQQQQMQGQVAPPVMTSADRAYAAAQAQVEAHKKQSASSQQQQSLQGMVKGAGKMRARPRIRNLGRQPVNPNPNMSSPGDKEGDAKRDMDQDIDAYQNIIAQGSVSRVQQRAEGAGASLDRVRGPSTG